MQFQDDVVGGVTLIRPAIQSPDFVTGVSGWQIAADGSAEFNDVLIRGTVHAGTATDYVEVTPTPQPLVEFSTSHPDQIAPASIGFGAFGSNSFSVIGPDLGDGPDEIRLLAGIVNSFEIIYNSLFQLGHVDGDAVMRGGSQWFSWDTTNRLELNSPRILFNGTDRGMGTKGYTIITASTALGAGEVVAVTSPNIDFEVGRAYRITLHYQGSGNTANDYIGFRLRRTNVAGNSLFDSLQTHRLLTANAIVNGETSQIVYNNTGATLSTVIVGTVYRGAGAGNVQMFANAANPVWIEVEDIGEAADYPNRKAL